VYGGINVKEKIKLIQWFLVQYRKTSLWKISDLSISLLYLSVLIAIVDHKVRLKNIGAKIILLGYDHLFPESISLAARINGIVSVATQERYVLPWMDAFYIIDYFFSIGTPVKASLSQNPDVSIGTDYTIGSIRKDNLATEISLLKNECNETEGQGRQQMC